VEQLLLLAGRSLPQFPPDYQLQILMHMNSRQIIGKIHLWLGIPTGLLVFVIAVTGCLYAFQEEIQQLSQPYRNVVQEDKPLFPPSKLQIIAQNELPGKLLHSIKYHEKGKAAEAIFYNFEEHYYYSVFLNPYRGQVLKVRDNEAGFFHFILDGHFYLWLPPKIGQPVVATSTLIFVVILISGLILWFPGNKKYIRKNMSFSWSANTHWKKKIFDLHNILGFYVCLFALILAFTGLVWGFQWFANGLHKTAGGSKSLEYADPGSTKIGEQLAITSPIDSVWMMMQREYPQAKSIEVHPPETDKSSIMANANVNAGTYWKTDYRYFDQYTLKEIEVNHIYGKLKDAGFADKLLRMNYDIHVGAIGGFPGKIIVFLIGLLVASLPVTGFLIWWKIKN
jgi:uncharacterized iron-regulated membrane protein